MNAKLEMIVAHNEKELQKVNGDQNAADNLFTIEHNEVSVYNFFFDETLREPVEPSQYYGEGKLSRVILEFDLTTI